jgi:hypothetical protein
MAEHVALGIAGELGAAAEGIDEVATTGGVAGSVLGSGRLTRFPGGV